MNIEVRRAVQFCGPTNSVRARRATWSEGRKRRLSSTI